MNLTPIRRSPDPWTLKHPSQPTPLIEDSFPEPKGFRVTYEYGPPLDPTQCGRFCGYVWTKITDASHRLLAVTDFEGRRTTFAYSGTSYVEPSKDDRPRVTTYVYDLDGKVVTIIHPGP